MRKGLLIAVPLTILALLVLLFLSDSEKHNSSTHQESRLLGAVETENPTPAKEVHNSIGEPMLAWAGQRIVLTHDWHDANGSCSLGSSFLVEYKKTDGPGNLIELATRGAYTDPNSVTVQVQSSNQEEPNTDCTSHVAYTSDDAGEVSLVASVIDPNTNYSGQVHFKFYFMKLENVTLDPLMVKW